MVPALLKTLHYIVPPYTNSLLWRSARGRIRNPPVENSTEVAPTLPIDFNQCEQLRESEVRIDCTGPRQQNCGGEKSR